MILEIHRPILSKRLTQRFGENKACKVLATGKIVTKTALTCPAGSVDFYKSIGMLGHNGHDIQAIHGEAVYHAATFSGKMYVEKDQDGGIGVDVLSDEPIFFPGDPPQGLPVEKIADGGYYAYVKMRYWHLLNAIGFDGKKVVYGQQIGRADNTGDSSGDHLHFAPKWSDKNSNGVFENNGFYGAFDPAPYYNHDIFAGDAKEVNVPAIPPMTEQEKKEDVLVSLLWRQLLLLREELARMLAKK
jgi:hypothetical protein